MSTVIGIAFGNSSTSIAYEKDGRVDVIANQDGDRAIPTAISYVGVDEYHGQQAKNQLIRNAKNTVVYFRDFIGASYDNVDPTYNHASAHPVEKDGKAAFKLTKGEEATEEVLSIEEIAVRHLDRIRESAADFIGKPIDGAVIAVPTDFSEEKRQALVEVAAKANLKVKQVINEPTAALLAHVAQRAGVSPEDKLYVVADFGGTRCDGAVIACRGGVFTILATLHDYELGGVKLDEALSEFIAKDFEKQFNIDPRKEARAVAKLMAESEAARKTLSNTTTANFAIESLAGGMDYHTTINRLRFELTGRTVFNKMTEFVQNLVKKAELDVLDIDEVLLAGGVSFTPKVAASVSALFDADRTAVIAPSTETKALNPNELVARGCAIQASLIGDFEDEEIKESLQPVVTVAPHTTAPIGVVCGDRLEPILVDYTAVPIRATKTFLAGSENVLIAVHEGVSEIVTKTLEKAPKEEKKEDDDESDWSDDEEDEEVREKVIKPGKKLAELGLKGVTVGSKIEVSLSITKDLKLQVAAREVKAAGVSARGVTEPATL
ncbi:ribosome-associated complex subunit Ssz1p [Trichomonascus vanleenenianus]|uniref:ribosome-associated complex protein SSZ1 n=1 Tax=Trichomonascus vanleenenianus TaxID=2268995 RepID=UPI003ECAC718